MKKDEILKLIETKPEADFVIRTSDEEKTFLENYAEQVKEERLGKVFNDLDTELFNVTGQKRQIADENGNPLPLNKREKTFDFIKRVMGSYKSDAEKAAQLKQEIESLKAQVGTGDNKQLLADLESVRTEYNKLKETTEKEKGQLMKDFEKHKSESALRASLPTNLKKNLPEGVVKAYLDQTIDSLLQMSQWQDGKLVFIDKDGAVKRNPHNALQPYTASELLNERLKDIIETGRQTTGGPDLGKEITYEKDTKGNITKVNLYLPDSVRSKEDLSKFLVASGLLRGSKEYTAAYGEYSKGLPFTTN